MKNYNKDKTNYQDHSNHRVQLDQQIDYSRIKIKYFPVQIAFNTISIVVIIEFQLSPISPAVRQLLPTSPAHRAGVSTPHSTEEPSIYLFLILDTYHIKSKKLVDQLHSKHHALPDIVLQVCFHLYCNCHISKSRHPMKHMYWHLLFHNLKNQVDQHMFYILHLIEQQNVKHPKKENSSSCDRT